MTETLYATDNAAARLGISGRTLEKWRITGQGPAYRKIGRRVLYADSDLIAYYATTRRTSTSEAAGAAR